MYPTCLEAGECWPRLLEFHGIPLLVPILSCRLVFPCSFLNRGEMWGNCRWHNSVSVVVAHFLCCHQCAKWPCMFFMNDPFPFGHGCSSKTIPDCWALVRRSFLPTEGAARPDCWAHWRTGVSALFGPALGIPYTVLRKMLAYYASSHARTFSHSTPVCFTLNACVQMHTLSLVCP